MGKDECPFASSSVSEEESASKEGRAPLKRYGSEARNLLPQFSGLAAGELRDGRGSVEAPDRSSGQPTCRSDLPKEIASAKSRAPRRLEDSLSVGQEGSS
ncbi:hypothetical protein KM043_012331 [Ampulex compressa]|nr:hypothetical protein KM043_012331 [Ampulex compressa]